MTLIFIYCVGCVLVGVLANNVGRNFGCWCFGAILFSPVLIGLLLLVVHLMQPNAQQPPSLPMQTRNSAEAQQWKEFMTWKKTQCPNTN
jgi:hypothetical protein